MSSTSKFLGMLLSFTIIAYVSTYITLNAAYNSSSKIMLFVIPLLFCGVIKFFSYKVATNCTFMIPIAYSLIFLLFLILSESGGHSLFDSQGWNYAGMAITSLIFIGYWIIITIGNVAFRQLFKK